MRWTSFWLLLIFSCTLTYSAFAGDKEAAKAAFDEGTQLFSDKKYSEAAERFREAYALKATWKLLYNLGQAEAAAKRYGLALEAFERYLAEGGDEIENARRSEVLDEIRKMRDMVGDLAVDGPTDAVVTVDGVERGTLPMSSTIILTAGTEHRVVVSLDGETLYETDVRVRSAQQLGIKVPEDDSQEAVVTEGPVPETSTDVSDERSGSAPAPAEGNSRLRNMGILFSSLGGALLIGGTVTGIMAVSKQKELDKNCIDGICYGGGTQEIEDSRDGLNIATDALLGAGLAFAVTGVIMVIRAKKKDEQQTAFATPVVGSQFMGIMAEKRF